MPARLLAFLAFAIAAWLCAPAQAATSIERSLSQRDPGDETFTSLHYVASSGERNRVRIYDIGEDFVISDRGARGIALRALGCRRLGPRRVRCAGRNVAYLGVGLHGGDDRAFVFAALNADVFGGPGHDTISVGGGLFASGGSGDDRIFGSASEDIFVGGPGRDLLVGRGGDDSLYGGTGDDRLEVADRGSALGTIDCGPGFDALGVDDPRDAFAPHRCENVIRVRRDGRGRPGSYLRRRPGSRLGTGSDRQSSVCPDC